MALSKKITFNNFSVEEKEEGYYEIIIGDKEDFNAEDLNILVEAQKQLGGKILPVLVICSEYASTNTELLSTLAKNENDPYSKVDAFVIKSIAQKILANFYIKINKPERPTKFFNDKQEAVKWLKNYL